MTGKSAIVMPRFSLRLPRPVVACRPETKGQRMVTRASGLIAVSLVIVGGMVAGLPRVAVAQQLSDRSVALLMDYAWTILPAKFTTQTGKVIKVDKSNKDGIVVPVKVGRDIIQVARLSAYAQICNLPNAQTSNYRAMMHVEQRKKKWSDQQLLYISQLHLFTILWLTGNVEVSVEGEEKSVAVIDSNKLKKPTCSDAERKNVQKRIKAYVDSVAGKKS